MDAFSRGFLNEDYRLFHSVDRRDMDFDAHFHEFHKIVVCLSGAVQYAVEGQTTVVRAGEMLLIPRHCIHRSLFRAQDGYERMILWINDDFLTNYHEPAFERLFGTEGMRLLRPDARMMGSLLDLLRRMEQSEGLLNRTYLLQFLIFLSQAYEHLPEAPVRAAPKLIADVMTYIMAHLAEPLPISVIAGAHYVSESYLMHAFRRATGFSVHQYILGKRLMNAAEEIRRGEPVILSAQRNGFEDYSSFLKLYKKVYGKAPTK